MKKEKSQPPVTLRRLFEVIFSHVSPLQKEAILEDIEALEEEMDFADKHSATGANGRCERG